MDNRKSNLSQTLKQGFVSFTGFCEAVGISRPTFYDWLQNNPERFMEYYAIITEKCLINVQQLTELIEEISHK